MNARIGDETDRRMTLAEGSSVVEVNGIEIELAVRGRGRPLLFLHPEIGFDRAGAGARPLARERAGDRADASGLRQGEDPVLVQHDR